MKLCVVIPMRDRESQLTQLIPRLHQHLTKVEGYAPYEILFVVSTQASDTPYNKALSLNVAVAWFEALVDPTVADVKTRRRLLRVERDPARLLAKYGGDAGGRAFPAMYCFHDVDVAPVNEAFLDAIYHCENPPMGSDRRCVMRYAGSSLIVDSECGAFASGATTGEIEPVAPRVPSYRLQEVQEIASETGDVRIASDIGQRRLTPVAKWLIRFRLLKEPRGWKAVRGGAVDPDSYTLLPDKTLGPTSRRDDGSAEPVQHVAELMLCSLAWSRKAFPGKFDHPAQETPERRDHGGASMLPKI